MDKITRGGNSHLLKAPTLALGIREAERGGCFFSGSTYVLSDDMFYGLDLVSDDPFISLRNGECVLGRWDLFLDGK